MPLVLALTADRLPVANSVTFAFALAASTFCPLLVLGIWWRGLTAKERSRPDRRRTVCRRCAGAHDRAAAGGLVRPLMSQPAAWSVPVGFALMVGVSLLTRADIPTNVARTMVRLHTPERLNVDRRF